VSGSYKDRDSREALLLPRIPSSSGSSPLQPVVETISKCKCLSQAPKHGPVDALAAELEHMAASISLHSLCGQSSMATSETASWKSKGWMLRLVKNGRAKMALDGGKLSAI